jgi:hypothetical protein
MAALNRLRAAEPDRDVLRVAAEAGHLVRHDLSDGDDEVVGAIDERPIDGERQREAQRTPHELVDLVRGKLTDRISTCRARCLPRAHARTTGKTDALPSVEPSGRGPGSRRVRGGADAVVGSSSMAGKLVLLCLCLVILSGCGSSGEATLERDIQRGLAQVELVHDRKALQAKLIALVAKLRRDDAGSQSARRARALAIGGFEAKLTSVKAEREFYENDSGQVAEAAGASG